MSLLIQSLSHFFWLPQPIFLGWIHTWSTNEAMSLLVENPERLPDLVLDLGVLDLPEKLIFANLVLNPTHLVISQTNSLKLIEPFPSWSISPISSWKTKESKFMIDGLFLLFQPDQIREICSSIVRSMGCSTIFKIKPFCVLLVSLVLFFCFFFFTCSSKSDGLHPKVRITW